MVSFQCEACNDVLTKKKLDPHRNRCWNAVFTCIDCMTTFQGNDYRFHTSCMTEAQKYEGALYKEKKGKGQNGAHTPKQAYVEDAIESPNLSNQVAIVDAPPPAPSPPPATESVNVFDFMVSDKSPGVSGRSSASSSRSSSPGREREVESDASSPYSVSPGQDLGHLARVGYTYGSGPVKPSMKKYESDLDFMKTLESQFGPPLPSTAQTPAPPVHVTATDIPPPPRTNGHQRTDSQKKRKRPEVEELDLSATAPKTIVQENSRALMHSGLTGGLNKMLSEQDERMEDSPLSPKKRHKHTRSEELYRRHKERESHDRRVRDRDERHERHERRKHRSHRDRKAIEGPAPLKAIEYHKTTDGALIKKQARQAPEQAHSEYFLSLVDKGPDSRRGMSVWGTMKMFHEGLYTTSSNELYSSATKELDERRLFKGLRMRLNKQGEIVLFARPERELSPPPERY